VSTDFRKVMGGLVLSILWMCAFLFIKSSLVIDWAGDGSITTPLLPVLGLLGLLVIVAYHIFYHSSSEANKLSWTVVLTVAWLAIIIFYPFKDPANTNAGAVGFFALVSGLGVVVLWVRFFSDEVVV
jgi:hypothetical protein